MKREQDKSGEQEFSEVCYADLSQVFIDLFSTSWYGEGYSVHLACALSKGGVNFQQAGRLEF